MAVGFSSSEQLESPKCSKHGVCEREKGREVVVGGEAWLHIFQGHSGCGTRSESGMVMPERNGKTEPSRGSRP